MHTSKDTLAHVFAQVLRRYITEEKFVLDESNDTLNINTPSRLYKFVEDILEELKIGIDKQ